MDVFVAGTGITPHGFFPDRSWKDLVRTAATEALAESGIARSDIDGGYVSMTLPEIIEQQNLGAIVAEELSLPSGAFGQVVAACAGGLIALQAGVNMITSGRYRHVLLIGVEKTSDTTATADSMLSYMDADFEAPAGFDYVDSMALVHAHYMEQFGATDEQIASFAVQDRWYSSRNRNAIEFGRPALTPQAVLASGFVSRPITRAECGKACDGASAIVLTGSTGGNSSDMPRVRVTGIAQATGPNYMGLKIGYPQPNSDTLAQSKETYDAAQRAYAEAGITVSDVDIAQVHDCFTVMGVIHLEGLGLFNIGEGAAAVEAGETAINGRCPTNTDGGRIGLGHPTGATGISIVVESTRQLQGRCGDRQVAEPRTAVCQAMGGNNATSAVAVLQRAGA